MKNLIACLAFLFLSPSGRAQTVTVNYASKVERSTTQDLLTAVKPCTPITEILTTSDALLAVVRAPIVSILVEKFVVSETVSVAWQRQLQLQFSFPSECALALSGNVLTCRALADRLEVTVASTGTVSTGSVVATQP